MKQSTLIENNKNKIINSAIKYEQQNDRKQGFEVIWYYCYLKYFVGKTLLGNKQQQQQQQLKKKQVNKLSSSPLKQQQQHQSLLSTNNNNNNNSHPCQQQQQHSQQQPQPLTTTSISQTLNQLKQNYLIQTIQCQSDYTINTIKQRALLSRNDRFFVIQPQQQIKQMQQRIRSSSVNIKNGLQEIQSCLQDMILQLYSYYLNSRNVYLIYKKNTYVSSSCSCSGNINNSIIANSFDINNGTKTNNNINNNNINNNINMNSMYYQNNSISSSIQSTQNRLKMILTHNSSQSRLNTSKDSKTSLNNQRNQRRSYGSLKSSLVRNSNNILGNNHNNNIGNKLLEQDSILMMGNLAAQSLLGQGQKMDNKIQQMQIIDKFTQFDGLQLWNIKYKKIPHTYIKFKKQSWTKCLNLPILHPSSPKTINQLPIIPRITKLNPSIDKLLPFVSLIKMLQKYFPNLLPSIDSIYQYNNMPYVFLQEDNGYGSWKWQTNIGVLCYFVVYGNDQETLSIKKVQRWVQQNGDTVLGRTIKEMTKRQKEKNRKRKELLRSINHNNNENVNNNNNNNNSNNNNNNTNNSILPPTPTATLQPQQPNPTIIGSSLHMLISKDENSDLAIW